MNVRRVGGHFIVVVRHLEDAVLHAYLREELDAPEAAAVDAHIGACPRCAHALRRVSATLSLLDGMAPPAWDDLKWQRLFRSVKAQAVEEAESRLHRGRGRNVALGAAAAAVLVALGSTLWLQQHQRNAVPRVQPLTVAARAPVAEPAAPTKSFIQASEAMSVELGSGAQLELAPDSRLWLPVQPGFDPIELEHGAMAVQLATPPDSPLRVKTPGFMVWARSEDFTVSYWGANQGEVHARSGVLEVVPEAGPPQVVLPGEPREVVPPKPQHRRAPRKAAKPAPAQETGETTTVEVLAAPELDPIAQALRAANRAFYTSRDLPEAIAQAKIVLAAGIDRREAREARILLCHAYVAQDAASEAVEACTEALQITDGEERQEIHQMLGNIYRSRLNDCRSAVLHYGKAMVFGRRSLLDTAARLGRLRCWIALDELDQAKADLAFLEKAGDAPEEELWELRRELELREGR